MTYKPNPKEPDDDPTLYDWALAAFGAAILAIILLAVGYGSHEATKQPEAATPPAKTETVKPERPWYDAPGNSNETFRDNFGR